MTLSSLGMATSFFGAFVAALFAGSMLLPGPVRAGAPPPGENRRRGRLHGLGLFGLVALAVAGTIWWDAEALTFIAANGWSFFIAANIFAWALAAALFLMGRPAGASRRRGSSSGLRRAVRDFYYGRELNPTWFGVDLKLFSYRPSLMALALVNVSCALVQFQRTGHLGGRMVLFQVMTLAYVANYFHFEDGMRHTWDVVAERFGWMLVWGDYVLVPFFYSLPAWYLVGRDDPLPPSAAVASLGLFLVGFWLFRGSNGQKHRFKVDPNAPVWGRPPETLGGRLLVSGFWGVGRKLNYTGELCMYVAWTLPCGAASPVPYLVPLWLAVLLVHRARRDDRRCREKYGALWEAYCGRARFRMIPFVY